MNLQGTKARFQAFDFRLNPRCLVAGETKYAHRFGGAIGAIEPRLERAPIHVLYSLDLRDPLLDFLGIKGKTLPLLFPMTVDGGSIAYQCQPAGGVKLFGKSGKRAKDWPRPDYPASFPEIPIVVRELTYAEHRAAIMQYQIGPTDWLGEDDQVLLARLGSGFTQLGGIQEQPFGEPYPPHGCPNPRCPRTQRIGMDVFVSVWNHPVPGVTLWEEGEGVVIEFSICETCKAIIAHTMVD